MVDLDNLGSGNDGGKKKKKKKKKKKSGGESTDAYTLSDDEKMPVSGEESPDIYDESERLADIGGSDEFTDGTSSLTTYKNKQVDELKQFYSSFLGDVKNVSVQMSDGEPNIEDFTVAFQAAVYNLANYKAGIAQTLMEEFGKSKTESVQMANIISKKAGEEKMVNEVSEYLTKKLMGV